MERNNKGETMSKYDKLMMEVATITARESYCTKYKVGTVLARDGRIVANGYNGTVSGVENICEYKEMTTSGMKLKTSPFVVHAEQNLLAFCAKEGIKTNGLTMYTTLSPCTNCAKYIVQAGIVRVVYLNRYKDDSGIDFLRKCGIEVEEL